MDGVRSSRYNVLSQAFPDATRRRRKDNRLRVRSAVRRGGWLLLAAMAVAAALAAHPAQADGGAPNVAYVVGAGANGDALAIVDVGQRQQTGTITIGKSAQSVVLSSDFRYAYVTLRDAGQLAIVDLQQRVVVARLATGKLPMGMTIAFAPAATLYIANSGSDSVSVIAPDTQQTLATIPVGHAPTGVALAGPGSGITETNDTELYVTNSGSDTVSVISTQQRRVIATIPVPGGPRAVVVPASGGVGYVATLAGTIEAVSLASHTLLGTVLRQPSAQFGWMDYDAITGQIFAPEGPTNQVAILRPVSAGYGQFQDPQEPARTLALSGTPAAVAITFDGAFGFATLTATGQVAMFDATNEQVLKTITVGGAPRAVVSGSYPPLLSRQGSFIVGIGVTIVTLICMIGAAVLVIRQARNKERSNALTPTPPSGDVA